MHVPSRMAEGEAAIGAIGMVVSGIGLGCSLAGFTCIEGQGLFCTALFVLFAGLFFTATTRINEEKERAATADESHDNL